SLRKKVVETATKKKTGIFDSHPCDADRVRNAAAMNRPGVIHLTEAASNLFNDFENLSKAATRFHYESNFELRITEHNLMSHEVASRESQTQAEGESALRDYFLGLKLTLRPILIPAGELPSATNEAL